MSGVVIRCQNCGTTQATLGECEACHEAEVRYYCPNHSPGRWLDEPLCTACGARVGVPGRKERVSPPAVPASPTPPGRRGFGDPPRRPVRRSAEFEEEEPEVFTGPVHTSDPARTLLEELLRSGMIRRAERVAPSVPDFGGAVATGFGCLRRIAVIAFFLMMLAAMFVMGLFGFSLPANVP